MTRLLLALAPLTLCSLLSGCNDPDKVVEHLPTPSERLVCEKAGARPAIPAEYVIDWGKITTLQQAADEHAKYVATVRKREGAVAGYIVQVEKKLFVCYTNVEWRRRYERDLSSR